MIAKETIGNGDDRKYANSQFLNSILETAPQAPTILPQGAPS